MTTLILFLSSHLVCVYIGKKFQPAIKRENGYFIFQYKNSNKQIITKKIF